MDDTADLLTRLEKLVPGMQSRAPSLDETGIFPTEDIEHLAAARVLAAPVPSRLGGLGLGTEPAGAAGVLTLLVLLGRGNLALGRLIEAHINALRLVFRFGDDELQHRAADDALGGNLLGLWVTDPPGGGLRFRAGGVAGEKQFCSGAGHVSRTVVTAGAADGGTRLAYVSLDRSAAIKKLPGGLAGMRAATTGQVSFDQTPATLFGGPGDYLREPDFSCGAWRTSAVTLGGLDALMEQFRIQLVARDRAGDPHQQARFGQALMALESARLWMAEAALRAESAGDVSYIGLARLAVERACLDIIELVQRSLGVAALMRQNPAERLCRDLATYLRQPAGDLVLTEAAAAALRPPPSGSIA